MGSRTGEISELEAEMILRKAQEQEKAKKILRAAKYPPGATTALVAVGSIAGSYGASALREAGVPWLSTVVCVSAVVLLSVFIEQWSLRRRLEAAIVLLLEREAPEEKAGQGV